MSESILLNDGARRYADALNDPTLQLYCEVNICDETKELVPPELVVDMLDRTPDEIRAGLVNTYKISPVQAQSVFRTVVESFVGEGDASGSHNAEARMLTNW